MTARLFDGLFLKNSGLANHLNYVSPALCGSLLPGENTSSRKKNYKVSPVGQLKKISHCFQSPDAPAAGCINSIACFFFRRHCFKQQNRTESNKCSPVNTFRLSLLNQILWYGPWFSLMIAHPSPFNHDKKLWNKIPLIGSGVQVQGSKGCWCAIRNMFVHNESE